MDVNRGTSEDLKKDLESGRSYKRSFNDEEEDYAISLFCEIRSNFIVAKLLEAIITENCKLVVNEVMAIMIAADEEGLLLSKDPKFVRDWIIDSVLSEIDHFIKIEGYDHE